MGINLPNGAEVGEIVLPDGSQAERVIGPNGSTLWERNAIPDLEVYIEEGSGTFTETSEYYEFFAESPEDGEIAAGTVDGTIDMTDVEQVFIDWEHSSTSSEDQDVSYIGVDSTLADINKNNAESGSIDAFIINKDTNFSRRTDSFDVSALTGDYNLGKGVQISSSGTQFVELDVYAVYGEDSGGERLFEINIPGGD